MNESEKLSRSFLVLSLGFIGWFLLMTLLWVWVLNSETGTEFINPARFLPLLVTIVGLIILYRAWREIFLGIVGAIVFNAIATLLVTFAANPGNNRVTQHIITMVPFYLPFLSPEL
jgi:hypothetical protein